MPGLDAMREAGAIPIAMDSFGNALDPPVGYARGRILRSHADEVLRLLRGRKMVASRVASGGLSSVYNLTGVTRAFPLSDADVEGISTQLSFYAYYDGMAEPVGVAYAGGEQRVHAACFATRVSAAFLATMVALIGRGDRVVSAVPNGRSHPSVQNAVDIAGGVFTEFVGVESALGALAKDAPRMLVITTITPQKHAFPEADIVSLTEAVDPSRTLVILDDAHAAVRMGYFKQAPPLRLGRVDIAICSMDKHLWGPRAALIVGRHECMDPVRTTSFRLGVEAPFATYVASMRAMEGFSPKEIEKAGVQAAEIRAGLEERFPAAPFYAAGPGVALHEDDLVHLVAAEGGRMSELVPMEVSSLVAMELLQRYGFVTILGVGMPGSAAALRLMPYPDGERAGTQAIVSAVADAVASAAKMSRNMAAMKEMLGA